MLVLINSVSRFTTFALPPDFFESVITNISTISQIVCKKTKTLWYRPYTISVSFVSTWKKNPKLTTNTAHPTPNAFSVELILILNTKYDYDRKAAVVITVLNGNLWNLFEITKTLNPLIYTHLSKTHVVTLSGLIVWRLRDVRCIVFHVVLRNVASFPRISFEFRIEFNIIRFIYV